MASCRLMSSTSNALARTIGVESDPWAKSTVDFRNLHEC